MKTLITIFIALGLMFDASAQRGGFHGGAGFRGGYASHVSLGYVPHPSRPAYYVTGYRTGWYWGFGFYGPMYVPYSYDTYSNLGEEIEDIKFEYGQLINDAKHDHSISRYERRKKVSKLKYERDQTIIQARKRFYNGQ
jgi:hypothetical protein